MSDRATDYLDLNDVISLDEDCEEFDSPSYQIKHRFGLFKTFEFKDFQESISRMIGLSSEVMDSFKEGIPCRVMTTRKKGWQLGKIRLKLEIQFVPDNISDTSIEHFDSPLDEIRSISS